MALHNSGHLEIVVLSIATVTMLVQKHGLRRSAL